MIPSLLDISWEMSLSAPKKVSSGWIGGHGGKTFLSPNMTRIIGHCHNKVGFR